MKKFPKNKIKEINDTEQAAKKLTNFEILIKGQKSFNQAFWGVFSFAFIFRPSFFFIYLFSHV